MVRAIPTRIMGDVLRAVAAHLRRYPKWYGVALAWAVAMTLLPIVHTSGGPARRAAAGNLAAAAPVAAATPVPGAAFDAGGAVSAAAPVAPAVGGATAAGPGN